MHLDARELRAFYLSPLGRTVRQIVSAHIRTLWPDLTAKRLAGLGHTTPYLRPFLGEAERLFAIMPAAEGVLPWPREGPNMTALAFEHSLPLPDASVDFVLVMHALEATDDPRAMLREIWRVLVPGGRVLMIVPHRSGVWARTESTPFGIGRPYSKRQICRLAQDSLLAPERIEPLLFVPPTSGRFLLGSAGSWEQVGGRLWPRFAGALALEAEKQMYAGLPTRKKPRGVKVLVPALAPGRASAACAGRQGRSGSGRCWGEPVRSLFRSGMAWEGTAEAVTGAAGTPPVRRTGSRTTRER